MMTVEDALDIADNAFANSENNLNVFPEDTAVIVLAAEVRRLREQVTNDGIQIESLEHKLESFREENERLRKDAERYRWLRDYGDASHFAGRMFVTRYIGSATIPAYHGGALDSALDAARGAQ